MTIIGKFEVSECGEFDYGSGGFIEVITSDDQRAEAIETFWTLYVRSADGFARAICNRSTEEDCTSLLDDILAAAKDLNP